jgi:hypothetical protein
MKCQKQMDMKNPEIVKTARGGFMGRGTCTKCGTNMSAMMSKVNAEAAVKAGAKKGY